ncbi:MAG TPA: efflux transporter outer membrane subunit [Bordetella sp.]
MNAALAMATAAGAARLLKRGLLPATMALALAGCAFEAPTKPPALPDPARYTAAPLPADTVAADGTAQHFSLGERPVPQWWRRYGSETLDAWIDEGLRNSPTLESAGHALAAARETLRGQIGAVELPTVDVQVQTERQRALGLPAFGQPTNLYNVYTGQLALSYDLDLSGAARYGIAQVTAQVDRQSFELDTARRTLAANIVMAAISAASADAQRQAAERLAALAHSRGDIAARARGLGAASPADVLTVQQEAASLDAALPALRAQTQRARHALAVLMGRSPDQAPPVLPLDDLRLPDDVPVSVPSELLHQRPDVLAAEAGVRISAAQIGVATANLFPQISLSASFGTGAFTPPNLFSAAGAIWGAGLSIAQPIFHGGELRAQRRAAMENYDASLAQYRQTVLNAFQNVADTLTALHEDAQALQSARQAADAARASFELADARYRLGAVAYPEQVLAEQQWQNAQQAVIQSRAARLSDTAGLFQAMGSPP